MTMASPIPIPIPSSSSTSKASTSTSTSPSSLPSDRPLSVGELTQAARLEIDSSIPLKRYLGAGHSLRKQATVYSSEGDFQTAFLLLVKVAQIVIEEAPKHKDYVGLDSRSRNGLQKTAEATLKDLSTLKPIIKERYDGWARTNPQAAAIVALEVKMSAASFHHSKSSDSIASGQSYSGDQTSTKGSFEGGSEDSYRRYGYGAQFYGRAGNGMESGSRSSPAGRPAALPIPGGGHRDREQNTLIPSAEEEGGERTRKLSYPISVSSSSAASSPVSVATPLVGTGAKLRKKFAMGLGKDKEKTKEEKEREKLNLWLEQADQALATPTLGNNGGREGYMGAGGHQGQSIAVPPTRGVSGDWELVKPDETVGGRGTGAGNGNGSGSGSGESVGSGWTKLSPNSAIKPYHQRLKAGAGLPPLPARSRSSIEVQRRPPGGAPLTSTPMHAPSPSLPSLRDSADDGRSSAASIPYVPSPSRRDVSPKAATFQSRGDEPRPKPSYSIRYVAPGDRNKRGGIGGGGNGGRDGEFTDLPAPKSSKSQQQQKNPKTSRRSRPQSVSEDDDDYDSLARRQSRLTASHQSQQGYTPMPPVPSINTSLNRHSLARSMTSVSSKSPGGMSGMGSIGVGGANRMSMGVGSPITGPPVSPISPMSASIGGLGSSIRYPNMSSRRSVADSHQHGMSFNEFGAPMPPLPSSSAAISYPLQQPSPMYPVPTTQYPQQQSQPQLAPQSQGTSVPFPYPQFPSVQMQPPTPGSSSTSTTPIPTKFIPSPQSTPPATPGAASGFRRPLPPMPNPGEQIPTSSNMALTSGHQTTPSGSNINYPQVSRPLGARPMASQPPPGTDPRFPYPQIPTPMQPLPYQQQPYSSPSYPQQPSQTTTPQSTMPTPLPAHAGPAPSPQQTARTVPPKPPPLQKEPLVSPPPLQQQHHHPEPDMEENPFFDALESGAPLRGLDVPEDVVDKFVAIADPNTESGIETCGLLLGSLARNVFTVTHLLIPKQTGTPDTCTTTDEDEIFEYCARLDKLVLGWIHTHPTQTCFMSSVDLHTHCGYQLMLSEAIAIVVSPHRDPSVGVFRMTDPPGLKTVTDCREGGSFHPHPPLPIYTDATHVVLRSSPLEVFDLR